MPAQWIRHDGETEEETPPDMEELVKQTEKLTGELAKATGTAANLRNLFLTEPQDPNAIEKAAELFDEQWNAANGEAFALFEKMGCTKYDDLEEEEEEDKKDDEPTDEWEDEPMDTDTDTEPEFENPELQDPYYREKPTAKDFNASGEIIQRITNAYGHGTYEEVPTAEDGGPEIDDGDIPALDAIFEVKETENPKKNP